jgi:hypothetical protein
MSAASVKIDGTTNAARAARSIAVAIGARIAAVISVAVAAGVVGAIVVGPIGPGVARAEPVGPDIAGYEAEGEADSAASDPRVAALDDAFARAVSTALGDVVPGEVRNARRAELDREIIGHARLWVAKFSVLKDQTTDSRRQLTVMVRVDRDKMRARLAELKIETRATAPEVRPATSRSVVTLLRVTSPSGVAADWGPSGDHNLPGLGAIGRALRDAGMSIVRAPDAGPAPRPTGDLPLEDDEAESITTDKADLVAIAAITLGAPVPVRGVPQPGVLITARVKLIERRGHKLVGQGVGISAAADTPGLVGQAVDRAVAAAMADVLPPQPVKLAQPAQFKGNDTPLGEPGVVNVRLPAKTSWALVLAEQRYLAGAKNVSRATLRRLSPGGYVIGVATTDSVDRVASIARKPPVADASVSVKVAGEVVEVTLSGGSP